MFKYFSLLRAQPPSSTIFNEIKAIAEISFRFAERSKSHHYVTSLSNSMQGPVPREKILSAGSLLEEFRADELASVLQLLDPMRASVGLSAKELPPGVEGTFDQTEPIYGTEYKQMRLDDAFMQEVCRSTRTRVDLYLDRLFQVHRSLNCTCRNRINSSRRSWTWKSST